MNQNLRIYELAPTCFIVMVFLGSRPSHAGQEKMSYTHTRAEGEKMPYTGNRAPDPKKNIEKSVFLHPGGFEPRTKQKQSDLQYSRTSSKDVYEYYRPNRSKIMYSNTRREDVKQYCKSQRLWNGSPPPHPPRRDMNGQTPST